MMMRALSLAAFFLSTLAYAEGESFPEPEASFRDYCRLSSVSFAVNGARGFTGFDLGARFGLDRMWQIFGQASSGSSTLDGQELSSREGRVGADAKLRFATVHGALVSRVEPGDLSSTGLNLGGDLTVSDLWEAKLLTLAFLDLEAHRYRFGSNNSGLVPKTDVFSQVRVTLGMSQEVYSWLAFSGFVSAYRYGENAQTMSRAVSGRRAGFARIEGLIEGFPSDSATAEVHFQPLDPLGVGVSISSTGQTFEEGRTRGVGVSLSYLFQDHWIALVDAAGSRFAGGGAPAIQLGLGLVYQW
jgi:hypothetical protein